MVFIIMLQNLSWYAVNYQRKDDQENKEEIKNLIGVGMK